MASPGRADELAALAEPVRASLAAANEAREAALAASRAVIRSCGRAIRAVHRLELEEARRGCDEAAAALADAQRTLEPHPRVAHAGFLHDAAKEYVEARVTLALVAGEALPSADELGVEGPAWLNGLAEAASELRRHALDRLRAGALERAEELLGSMDDVYGLLVTVDEPDAITGGLRRTTDALRAVLERTRADLTLTLVQARLQTALERAAGSADQGRP